MEGEDVKLSNLALYRMSEAHKKGRGVRLSWEELHAFSIQLIGQWWAGIDKNGNSVEEDVG